MITHLEIIKKCKLFNNIEEENIIKFLNDIKARSKRYSKGSYVITAGDRVQNIGVVLSGEVQILKDDYWGNRSIVGRSEPSEMFGEAFCLSNLCEYPIDVMTTEDTEVLLINCKQLLAACDSRGVCYNTIIRNMLRIIAERNINLVRKIEHISKRTTKGKLLSYLSFQAKKNNSSEFYIPFNREELAAYLSVDRSAMSNELCKMRNEGILSFKRNHFILYNKEGEK
ncbi:MAG: Crp/Fnr family transcriptional regulator [Acutalibacteraceae bacterium]